MFVSSPLTCKLFDGRDFIVTFLVVSSVSHVVSHSVVSDSLQPHGLYSPWNSPLDPSPERIHPLSPGDLKFVDFIWDSTSVL